MPRSSAELGPLRPRAVEVALAMFVDRGFAETSMRDIAGRLGVTTAALYYHFENKDDLLVAAVTPALDELEQLINGRTAARRPKVDPRAFLSRYAETVV